MRCPCAKKKCPCLSCLPRKRNNCQNSLNYGQRTIAGNVSKDLSTHSATLTDNSSLETGGLSDERPPISKRIDSERKDSSTSGGVIDDEEVSRGPVRSTINLAECHLELSSSFDDIDVNGLMTRAFGEPLIQSGGEDTADVWHQYWRKVAYLQGKHYDIPGGAIGRQYVDALAEEVSHVTAGNYPSDRLIVFSSLVLQRDRMIRKVADMRRVLDRRLKMWRNGDVDLLLHTGSY